MAKEAVYYGTTPTGKRIHLGSNVYRMQRKLGQETYEVWADTFCGRIMTGWEDGSMPPAWKYDQFCASCFRALAWQYFLERMEAEVQQYRITNYGG